MRRSGFFQDDFRPHKHHTTTMQKTLTLLVLQGNTSKTPKINGSDKRHYVKYS